MGRVVPILVHPLLCHPFLTLPLEAKLILVALFPTTATMEPHKLRLRLRLGLFTWFISTRLLNRFLLTSLLTFFPKEYFPRSAHKLDMLSEIICLWRKHGGAGVVSSRFLRWLGLGGKSYLWWVFGGCVLL
jgi:hypothetical protein